MSTSGGNCESACSIFSTVLPASSSASRVTTPEAEDEEGGRCGEDMVAHNGKDVCGGEGGCRD